MIPAKEVRAMPIQQVVDDPEWQEVRLSLRGNWVRNHMANVEALIAYLDKHGWEPIAVRRVLNVLTGTVHRAGHTAGQAETDGLRAAVRRIWKRQLGESFDPEDPRYSKGVIGAKVKDSFPE